MLPSCNEVIFPFNLPVNTSNAAFLISSTHELVWYRFSEEGVLGEALQLVFATIIKNPTAQYGFLKCCSLLHDLPFLSTTRLQEAHWRDSSFTFSIINQHAMSCVVCFDFNSWSCCATQNCNQET